jgi:SprT protein
MLNLKNITEAQKKQVEDRVIECFDKFFPGLNYSCHIEYRNDLGRAAGYADPTISTIQLNETLLAENFEQFLIATIPHEVAHILRAHLYPEAKQDHGKEFRKICMQMGYPEAAKTYNRYDTSSVVAKKPQTLYVYECIHGCMPYKLSKLLHNKIEKGVVRGCGECRTMLQYTHQTVTY